jgi:hypothetical protein
MFKFVRSNLKLFKFENFPFTTYFCSQHISGHGLFSVPFTIFFCSQLFFCSQFFLFFANVFIAFFWAPSFSVLCNLVHGFFCSQPFFNSWSFFCSWILFYSSQICLGLISSHDPFYVLHKLVHGFFMFTAFFCSWTFFNSRSFFYFFYFILFFANWFMAFN